VLFATGSEAGHETTVNLGGIHPGVPPHLFEVHGVQPVGQGFDLGEPSLEPQETHAATLEMMGLEYLGAAGDRAVLGCDSPARGGAEV
jgi:hypothetical protein